MIAVVGGGPAGCSAAITLATRGEEVTVFEREEQSRHKVCGEFLSGEALDILRDLDCAAELLGAMPIRRVRFASGNHVAEHPLPFPAASLARKVLDAALLARAESCGVRVRRMHVEGIAKDGNGWRVECRGGTSFPATHVVLANGKHDLRGIPRPAGTHPGLVGMKTIVRLSPAQQAALGDSVELATFPGGYAGLQAVDGLHANLAWLQAKQSLRGAPLEGLPALCAASRHLRERLDGAEPVLNRPLAIHPVPYGFVRGSALASNVWAVGDQAAVIPSFSGDGISIALYSGQLAAEMLLGGGTAQEFHSLLRRQLCGQVSTAVGISRALVSRVGAWSAMRIARLSPQVLALAAAQTRICA